VPLIVLLFVRQAYKQYCIEKSFTDKENGDSMEKVLLVGVGGAGCNNINSLVRKGISKCDFLAIHTDAEHLHNISKNMKKLLIGKATLHGNGAAGHPEKGLEAAKKARKALERAIKKRDLVILFTGMGGGTGAGAAPIVAQIAKKKEAIVIAFATIPFKLERARRMRTNEGLKNLVKSADTVILMENERLVEMMPNLSMSEAFAAMDGFVTKAASSLIHLHYYTSSPACVFASSPDVFANGGFGYMAWGEGKRSDKVELATKGVAKNIFLGTKRLKAKHAFVDILLGKNGTGREATNARDILARRFAGCSPEFFARTSGAIGADAMEILVLATGVKAPDFSVKEQLSKSSKEAKTGARVVPRTST
jgi:cell division protein FtsZ